MSNSIANLSVIFGGDTTRLDKAVRSIKRTLNSLKPPVADVSQSMAILNSLVAQGATTQNQADLAMMKTTLTVKKQEDSIRKLRNEYKALASEQDKNRIAGLKKQAFFAGIESEAQNARKALAERLAIFKAEKKEKDRLEKAARDQYDRQLAAAFKVARKYEAEQAAEAEAKAKAEKAQADAMEKQKQEADQLYTRQLAAARSVMRKLEAEQKATRELEQQAKVQQNNQRLFDDYDRSAREGLRARAERERVIAQRRAARQGSKDDNMLERMRVAGGASQADFMAALSQATSEAESQRVATDNARFAAGMQAQAARAAELQDRGLQYMQQFETRQQRINRQVAEARRMFTDGAISAQNYRQAVRGIYMQNSTLVQGFNQFRGAFTSLIGPLVILTTAWETLKKSVSLTAELDLARARLEVFTGSASAAAAQISELRAMSSGMALSFQSMTKGAGTMMGFGVEPGRVSEYLGMIGKITAGDNQRFEALTLAFSQMQAAGRLMGQELLQMVNAGFNPLKIISEETGVSMAQLKKEMEAGAMGAERIVQAFQSATSAGGMFEKMSDKIQYTFAGSISRLKNEWEQFLVFVTEGSGTNVFSYAAADLAARARLAATQPTTTLQALEKELELQKLDLFTGLGGKSAVERNIILANREEEMRRLEQTIEMEKKYGARVNAIDAAGMRMEFFRQTRDMDKGSVEYLKKKQDLENQIGMPRMRDLAFTPEERKRLEDSEKQLLNTQRAAEAFNDAITKASEKAIDESYGDEAARVHAMLQASVNEERKLVEEMIRQKKTADQISSAMNSATQAKDAELKKQLELTAAAEKQAKFEKDFAAQEKEKAREREQRETKVRGTRDELLQEVAYRQDILASTKEQARLLQIIRENKVSEQRGREIYELEQQNERLDKQIKLREKADKVKNPDADMVNSLAELNIMLQRGMINKAQYDKEQARIVGAGTSISTSAQSTTLQGSQEAARIFNDQIASKQNAQVETLLNIAKLLELGLAVQRRQEEILDEMNENKPVVLGK